MKEMRAVLPLLCCILTFLAIGGWYSVRVPPGEGVDEAAHFAYVVYLADKGRLPVQPMDGRPPEVWMGHHPPLYYALGALLIASLDIHTNLPVLQFNPHFRWDENGTHGWNVMLPIPASERWRGAILALQLLRWFGLLLATIALVFVYLTARRLLSGRDWAALGAVILVGLNPSFIYMAATVHHDVLLVTVFCAGIFLVVDTITRPITSLRLIFLGTLCGAAILTKLSGAVLLLVTAIMLVLRPCHPGDRMSRPLQIGVVTLMTILLAGWWLIRNQLLYGDPLGWRMFLSVHHHMVRSTPFTWGIFVHEFLAQLGRTFWGAFGFMHIILPAWTHRMAWAVTGVAVVGLCFQVARSLRHRTTFDRGQIVAWASVSLSLLLLFLSFVQFARATLGAGHGRYLFPAATAIGVLLVSGLNGYLQWRGERAITLALLGVLAGYAVVAPMKYVWPLYRLPPSPPAEELQEVTPVDLSYPGGVQLWAVKADSKVLVPGQGVEIATYWRAMTQVSSKADPYVAMTILSEDGVRLGQFQFWPEIATVPASWGDRIIVNRQAAYIPPTIATGMVSVRLVVYNGVGGPPIAPVGYDQTEVTLLQLPVVGAAVEVSPDQLPTTRRSETFAETLRLVAVECPAMTSAGSILPIRLYWEVLARPLADYTIFVHLVDEQGQIVAQMDRPPGGQTRPTSSWEPKRFLLSIYPLLIPAEAPSGIYRLRLGMYTWPDLTRQPVKSADGTSLGDFVIIGQVEIRADPQSSN